MDCPKCGARMYIMYGCGWDYDRLICSSRNCNYEEELKTIGYPKEQEKFKKCSAKCSEQNPHECGCNCAINEVKKLER